MGKQMEEPYYVPNDKWLYEQMTAVPQEKPPPGVYPDPYVGYDHWRRGNANKPNNGRLQPFHLLRCSDWRPIIGHMDWVAWLGVIYGTLLIWRMIG